MCKNKIYWNNVVICEKKNCKRITEANEAIARLSTPAWIAASTAAANNGNDSKEFNLQQTHTQKQRNNYLKWDYMCIV